MMFRRGPALWLMLPLAAVLVFALLLGFALIRMVGIENDMRVEAEQNMLWVMHQGAAAADRLTETVLLAELGEAGPEDIRLRYDILKSRVSLLNDGPQRRFSDEAGLGDDLDQLVTALDLLAQMLDARADADPTELHAALDLFSTFFGRAANKAMIIEWDRLGGRLESYRKQLRQISTGLFGIMGVGGALTLMLMLALRQSRQRTRMLVYERDFSGLLISSSGEGILAIDQQGQCSLWNSALTELFDRTSEHAIGRQLTDIAGFFATKPMRDAMADALTGKPAEMHSLPLFRPGAVIPVYVDLRIFPMRERDRIIGAIMFFHDSTDRHLTQQQEAATRARLEELVSARTRELDAALRRERSAGELYRNFAAMISHQFRTPLAVADSALQRLIRRGSKASTEEITTRATRAREAIAGLTRLVESTLEAARLEAGQGDARRIPCDLRTILADLCARHPEGADCPLDISAKGPATALCDPAHIEQVLENLLSNALKYRPPDTRITLSIKAQGEALICDIHNDGPAIADEGAHIFDRGFRGQNSAGIAGTGTGLFIARTLARMQGGDLELLPGGQGVTFRLTLPRAETATTQTEGTPS